MTSLVSEKPATREAGFTELVIVCCHAVYLGGSDPTDDPYQEKTWHLQPFQRSNADTLKVGEHETFLAHIQAGMNSLHRPGTLLVFSGGITTHHQISEARSYLNACNSLRLRGRLRQTEAMLKGLSGIATEEYATDSYQNLLFSIIKFWQLTGSYPHSITVITHAFKESRFLELHAQAIHWPAERIRVQGINPPFTAQELRETQEGEEERAHRLFERDPYGAHSPLADKRKARRWHASVFEAFKDIEEPVTSLLKWEGGKTGTQPFPERLPWT